MFILSVLCGALSFANYVWYGTNQAGTSPLRWVSVAAQLVIAVTALIAFIRYKGRRTHRSYDGGGYQVFTLLYAVMFIALLGSVSILGVLILRTLGIISTI